MQKKINWFWLQLKIAGKNIWLYVELICMVALLAIVHNINIPDGKNTIAGVFCKDSTVASKLVETLQEKESVFTYSQYEDEQSMYEDVESGRIECGFIFDDAFDELLAANRLRKSIIYICSPNTTKGSVMKESLYTVLFKEYSNVLLMNADADLYGDTDEKRVEELLATNEKILESDYIFTTNTVRVATKHEKEKEIKKSPVKVIAIFFMALSLIIYVRRIRSRADNYRIVLTKKDRLAFDLIGAFAHGLIPIIVLIITVVILE